MIALGWGRAGPWRCKIKKSTQAGLGGQRRPPGDMTCVPRLDEKGEVAEGRGHVQSRVIQAGRTWDGEE